MQDAEVMNQLGELITEWNVVDEQLIPVRFDILLRCSDMGHDLEVHRSRHCGEHTQTIRACIERRQFPIRMRDCRSRAQYLWEIGNDQPIRVMCISDDMHWAQAAAARLHAVYKRKAISAEGRSTCPDPTGTRTCAVHGKGKRWKDMLIMALTEDL